MKKIYIGALALFLSIALMGCSSNNTVSSSNDSANSIKENSSENKLQEVYSDDLISMSFVKKYDMPEVKDMFYFDVKANNKSNREISVYLQNSYINDTMFTVGSGVPLDLLPKKSATHSFFGKYEGTGIKSTEEINKISFKICVMDKSSNVLETTKSIEIKF
ncbi:hypothetical protein [Caproiciproducens galactitolivorans]|uniref:Lipoprotein n=1 Tax=Caproiciproducens galactitolivorans TaxID=642589 RepID=A0ABT4BS64_9FIRM|nr:hypothetical protein [Caproiciproducens galactitolivorans]MCY1713727.1 hypothetical protein [Caproiciproducens galactitolivorans]